MILSHPQPASQRSTSVTSPHTVIAGEKGIGEFSPDSKPLFPTDIPRNRDDREPLASRLLEPGTHSERCSIRSLPVEVLSMVFTALTSPSECPDHSELLNTDLRLVCRLWRDIIDRTPQLWTYVLLRQRRFNPKQLRVLVDRSKSCPLELRVHIQCLAEFEGLLSILQPAMARTRYLYLSCEPCNMHLDLTTRADWPALYEKALDVMRQLMETPAPLLEVLDLRMMYIPHDIFSGIAPPNLRSVHLLDCKPVLRTAGFLGSPLASLILDYCESWESIDDMLATLATLPHLRRFQWDTDCCSEDPPFRDPAAYQPKSVPLHHLECLDLSSSLDSVLSVVKILDFPASTSLILSGQFMDEPTINTPPFDNLLSRLSSTFVPHLRRSFAYETVGFQRLTIQRYRENNADGFSAIMDNPCGDGCLPAKFEFAVCYDTQTRNEYTAILRQMLSWPGMRRTVTHIVVDHEAFMVSNSDEWRALFDELPGIVSVEAHGATAYQTACGLFNALYRFSSSPHASERVRASNLRTVVLNGDGPSLSGVLISTLDHRAEYSLPQLEIKLHQSSFEAEMVEQLRRHRGVKNVKWDGTHKCEEKESGEGERC